MKKVVYALSIAVLLLCRVHCANSEYEETFYIRPLTEIPWTMAGDIPDVHFPREMNYTIKFSRGQTSLHLVKQDLGGIMEHRNGHHYHHTGSIDDLQTAIYTGTHEGTVLTLGCHEKARECLLHGSLYLDGKGWQIIPVEGQTDRYRAVMKGEKDILRVSTSMFNRKFEIQYEKSAFQHSQSFQPRKVKNEGAKYHRIVKRQTETTECNIIEMVAIADFTVWEYFLAKENGIPSNAILAIYEHYEALFSEVDFRFAEIEHILCIRVYLVDVEIQRTEEVSWSIAKTDGVVIGVSGVVVCGRQIFAGADLVACFTRDDIELFGDSSTVGAAFINRICTETLFRSLIVEDLHDSSPTDIAKFILTQFGVRDDSDIGCDDNDGFIGSGIDVIPGWPFEFSNCSTDGLLSKIESLNMEDMNCLIEGSITDEQLDIITENRDLAGEVISLDEQCHLTFGNGSVACAPSGTPSILETEDICTLGVFCTVDGVCTSRTRVYNGSPCGCGRSCLKGNCTEDTSVPLGGKCRDDCNCGDVNGVCVFLHESKGVCQCGSGGAQDGDNETCIIDCGALPDTPGGNYVLDSGDTTLGATATLVCLSGFSTSTNVTINCTNDGWGDPTEECALIDCGATPNVTDGNYVAEGGSGAGAIAVLVCSENYRANSTDTCISCTNEGVWSDPTAECIRDCGRLPLTSDGYFVLDSKDTTEGATASLVCCKGYETSSNVTITCENTDEGWSYPSETCEKKDCGSDLPTVNNGTYVANNGTEFGDVAVLVCDDGYTPMSTETCISCLYTGSWSSPLTSCLRDCGVPPVAQYGYYILTDTDKTTEGATAELICCEGFNTSMTVTIICEDTDDGWSDPAETCTEIDCGSLLPTVDNGTYVANNGTEFGDVAVLVCDIGYTAESTETCISCLYTGFWSSPLTSCQRDCGVPPVARDGYYILTDTDNTIDGATAELACCEGFNTSTTVIIICEDTDQGWSDPAETCTKIDCGNNLPTVDNGTYVANNGTEFGDVAVLVCDDGYTPMSSETCISCLYTGSWSSPLTSCQRNCGVPPVAEDGYYVLTDTDNTTEGATAELVCCEGFNTSMTVTIVCEDTDDGWSDPAETCTEIDCGGLLPTVNNGAYIAINGKFGDVAFLVCDGGYTPTSPETCIFCLYTGSWSSPLTSCLRDCGVPPVAQDGYYILTATDKTTQGATAELTCCEGYNTSMTVTIICEDTDEGWSDPAEKCTIIDCGSDLPTVENGTYVANNGTEFGDVAVLVCDDGYTPMSTETCISCLYTGSWSSPLTSCLRDCGVPPVAQDGYYILTDTDKTTEGAAAELTCCEGYNTSLTVFIICEDTNEGWSDPAETCTKIDCGSFLPSENNGTYVANNGTEFGDVAVLVCDDGYTPMSSETCISCLYTGFWSFPLTSCLRDCGVPPVAQDGYYILTDTDKTTQGATAELTCCEGYNTSMTVTIVCEDTNQGWSDPGQTCTKIDCGSDLPTVDNGTYVANNGTEFGDVAVLVCDDGYTPMSTETCISCLYTGSWSSPLTSCLRDCGVPPVAKDGYYVLTDTDNTTEGATAVLTCCEGYSIPMTISITCEDTDQGWTDPAETCTIIECSYLPKVANGIFEPQDGITVGSKALLVCDEGFAASSDDTSIVCGFDGTYSTANADCITDCGVYPIIPTGYFSSDSTNTTLGATADLVCCPGFLINETVTITCEEDGWSDPSETCEIGCPSIDWLQFGSSCYLFGSVEIAYQAARDFCDIVDNEIYDGSLVQVDTLDELIFLKNEMTTRTLQPTNGYWNDLFQNTTNGDEIWRTTGDPLVVADWSPGTNEPNDAGGRQSCTAFFRDFLYQQVDIQCANTVNPSEVDGLPFFPLCEVWIG